MEQQIQIKADDQTLKGSYANLAMINHTKEEFAIDFVNVLPPQGVLLSRIFMSPGHAKRLLAALDQNIKAYEKQFGKVTEAEIPEKTIGFTK
jgi:hypothetical protein